MTALKTGESLLKSPLLLVVVAVLTVVLIIFGFVVLWALKLLTGVILALVLLVISWTLLQTKALPTEKYPWSPLLLVFLPIVGLFGGIYAERTGAFFVTPLVEKAELITPYYAGEEVQWIQSNPETLLIFLLLICIIAVLIKSGSK